MMRRNLSCLIFVLSVAAIPLAAQAPRPLVAEADLLKEAGGVQLLHILKGAVVSVGAAVSGGFAATIDGWIPAKDLHDDKRDGFDISVLPAAGTTLRDGPAGKPLASARLGALFDKVETTGTWVHVKRTGWISAVAFAITPSTNSTPAAGVAAVATTIGAGTALLAQPNGAPAATLEAPLHVDVVEHRNGFARVRIDAWVRDAAVGSAPEPEGITAAQIRAAPDKFVGQTVEWTLQLIGVQKADDLRPEMQAGQPFLLARGPLPETGFVYVAVSTAEADQFRKLEPLAKIRIRATIKAGKSRFLPTPVLTLVRRLD
jgi:hypothetical protein